MRRLFHSFCAAAVVGTALLAGTSTASAAGPGSWTQAQVNAATTAGVAYVDAQCAANLDGHCGSSGFTFSETGMALVAYSVEQAGLGGFANMPVAHQNHVKAAIHYLLINQNAMGYWPETFGFHTYATGIDLAGLSAFTAVDPGVQAAITNGRHFLIDLDWQGPPRELCSSAQFAPGSGYCGGWNYDTGLFRSDESNTGFAMFGLFLTGGVPAAIQPVNTGWQNNIQELTASNSQYAFRNDGGGSYEPFITSGAFSSNANDTGTMLFGYGYDGVPGADPRVQAGLKLGQDVLDTYEESLPSRTGVYHSGAAEDGSCGAGSAGCDWFVTFDGGYHYSLFSLTKGLGDYITPVLLDPNNWYAKVVDLLLTQQAANGSWPQDGRDDGTTLLATAFAVSSLGLVAVEQAISKATGVPFNATEGMKSCGAVATFSDADSKAVAAEYTATIDWGDGTTSAGTVSGSNGSFTVSGCHTYAEEGGNTVTVTITDADNANNHATAKTSATVADATLAASPACASNSSQAFAGSTATFIDAASPSGTLSDFSATIDWGDGSSSTGAVAGPDGGPYAVSGAHTYSTTGFFTIITHITDVGGQTATATCSNVLIFAGAPGGGSFVIGDLESATGTDVTFWGAQWWKNNPTSSGSREPSFKGFAESPTTPACGVSWSADPGNSTPPPPGPLPDYMEVIVTSSYDKSGPAISGNTVHIVVVHTNPGYQPNPGHPGTGTVVAQVC